MNASDLQREFQNANLHEKWEAVYRHQPAQDVLNDRFLQAAFQRLAVPTVGTALDAGCGVGDHSFRLARLGYNVTGIDISEPMLQTARARATELDLTDRVTFACHGLEDLSSLEGSFDAIHCRGVLMHIPRWRTSLSQLCSKLKPGGVIVLFENNHRSIEFALVRMLRLLRRQRRKMEKTPDGYEFHDQKADYAPLTRVANLATLEQAMQECGVSVVGRMTSEFFDINRFPQRWLAAAIQGNSMTFRCGVPACLASGNMILGRKPLA